MHKLLVSVLFCVALLAIVQSATLSPNAIWGVRQPGDARLFYKIVKQKGSWFFAKTVEDVDYPGKGAYSTANITYIEAINQKPDSGSSATIEKGGVGFPFVKLHFKSSRTNGFDYILQIYGKLSNSPAVKPQQNYPPPYPPGPGFVAYPARPY